jgi:hypothetical protein
MSAAAIFFLFAVSGEMPNLTALASYETAAECKAAEARITETLGESGVKLMCISTDKQTDMAE